MEESPAVEEEVHGEFFSELAGAMNSRELKGLGNGLIISGKRRQRS